MIGYLYLAIALFCGAAKGYCGKKTSGHVDGLKDAMLTNTVRMVVCIVIGMIMIVVGGNIAFAVPNLKLLLISALSGVTTSVFVVTWLLSVKKGAYMMLDVFLTLGVLVPILLGLFLFDESVRLNQWIGLAILVVAVVIMCSYNNSIKEKITPFSLFLLVICGVSNGLTSFSQKLFVKRCADIPIAVFNLYTYIFSAIVLTVFYFVFKMRDKNAKNESFGVKSILGYVIVMAVCLFLNSYFATLAAGYLDSAKLYPLNQGAALALSSFMSAIFFKEKLTVKCIVGLVLTFIGLVVINVL